MTVRFYSNENFPLPVVEELRRLGYEVLTSLEAGNAGWAIPDEEVLAFATTQQRAVLTLNRKHFIRLHQTQAQHGGIVVCTFDSDFTAQAWRIHRAVMELPDLSGQLVRINRPHS